MKKILVINGSPKKERSSTMFVTNSFVKGFESTGEFESEILNVASLNIKHCLGCLGCWAKHEGDCIIKDDDIPMVKSKILEADVVVFSFPIFVFGVPGEMKVMMDRLISILDAYHGQDVPESGSFHGFRYDMSGKKLVLIAGCAWSDQRIFDPIEKQFDCVVGKDNYTALFCPQLMTTANLGMRPRFARYLKNYENAGAEFAKNGELSAATKDLLKKPIYSETVYKQLVESFWLKEKGLDASIPTV